jgi:hypothetical protein
MEYLTIEEKASLTGYFVLIDDQIERCQSIGVSAEFWENQKVIFQKAYDKISKNPSLEVIEIRKKYENTESCKH